MNLQDRKTNFRCYFQIAMIIVLAFAAIISNNVSTSAKSRSKTLVISNIDDGFVLPLNQSETIKLKSSPASLRKGKVMYTSSDNRIAKVNNGGVITAKKKGTVYITVTCQTQKKEKLETKVKVIVGKRISKLRIRKKPPKSLLFVGEKYSLKAKIFPASAANNKLIWSSSNKKVLKVTDDGIVKAKREGKAFITVKAADGSGKKARIKLRVKKKKVKKISLVNNPARSTISVGQKYQMTAVVSPYNASNKKLNWTSSDQTIISVNSEGVIKGEKPGSAVITAEASDGSGKKVREKINVIPAVGSVKIEATIKYPYIATGEKMSLTAKILPKNADQSVNWTSSDNRIATVDAQGTVQGVKEGTAVITAKAMDGSGKNSYYKINVVSLKDSNICFIAHRGYSGKAPENTMASFELAVSKDFGGMECDIYKTTDDVYVIHHDENLKRMFGYDKKIIECSYDELRGLTAIGGKNPDWYSADKRKIPTLNEFMELISHSEKRAVVELKQNLSQEDFNDIFDLISTYGINNRVDIISFHSQALIKMSEAGSSYEARHPGRTAVIPDMYYLCMDADKVEASLGGKTSAQWAIDHGFHIDSYMKGITAVTVEKMHKANKKVGIFTLNDFSTACYYIKELKVDFVTSDYNLLYDR